METLVLRIGFIVCVAGLAAVTLAFVSAAEPESSAPDLSLDEIETTAAAIKRQLDSVTILIEEQDAKLEALLVHIDETEDPGRKASLQDLADKLTRALDKLEAVKSDLSTKLDALTILIDRSKEP